ncbi:hypothetical protein ABFA07_022897 [Porites harrisoni]
MPPQRKVTKNSLSSWSIERKHSFGEFVGGWLEERRKVQRETLLNRGIYSRYQIPEYFANLPKRKMVHDCMESCEERNNDVTARRHSGHELVNCKNKQTTPIRIPVKNDLHKLRYRHRSTNHSCWNPQ